MKDKLQIDPRFLKILQGVLRKYPFQFYAFGSRTKQKSNSLSDLDLICLENIQDLNFFEIKEALDDLPIPFRISLVRKQDCSESFVKSIEKDLVFIKVFEG